MTEQEKQHHHQYWCESQSATPYDCCRPDLRPSSHCYLCGAKPRSYSKGRFACGNHGHCLAAAADVYGSNCKITGPAPSDRCFTLPDGSCVSPFDCPHGPPHPGAVAALLDLRLQPNLQDEKPTEPNA